MIPICIAAVSLWIWLLQDTYLILRYLPMTNISAVSLFIQCVFWNIIAAVNIMIWISIPVEFCWENLPHPIQNV